MSYRTPRQPRSKLRCTARYEGNLLSNQLEMSDVDDWANKNRLVFLIHGYNVRTSSAHRTLKKFENSVSSHSRAGVQLANDIAWFLWPGDMYGLGPMLSIPSYSFVVKRTPEIGKLLGEFLVRRLKENDNREIILVAHSLGCRVVLEALLHINASSQNAELDKGSISIFLMAAAVPVVDLDDCGILRPSVDNLSRSAVLFSNRDTALGTVFKIGQRLARGESTGHAVGRTGEPKQLFGESHETRWRHSGYWRNATDIFLRWMGCSARLQLPVHRLNRWKTQLHNLPRYPEN